MDISGRSGSIEGVTWATGRSKGVGRREGGGEYGGLPNDSRAMSSWRGDERIREWINDKTNLMKNQ